MPIDLRPDRNIYGEPAGLPDTGVRNGRLLPGPAAHVAAWIIVLAVVTLPVLL